VIFPRLIRFWRLYCIRFNGMAQEGGHGKYGTGAFYTTSEFWEWVHDLRKENGFGVSGMHGFHYGKMKTNRMELELSTHCMAWHGVAWRGISGIVDGHGMGKGWRLGLWGGGGGCRSR
jgi:hypothetical protein